MVFTTTGINAVSLAIGSFSSNRPQYIAIGSGSGAVLSSNASLVHETDRDAPTTVDNSITNEITYTGDWNSSDISGTTLREFGLFTESSGSGTMWAREGFGGVGFDGSNELQVQITLQAY